jgi:WD40 repeat protein/GTPase SAR1 family protein
MMAQQSAQFSFDAFLSHSSLDKDQVREIAERLRADGVRVWFDEWILKPGDSIPAKIENGLEHSRVLVLFMSAHAFGSDWVRLESGTFRFRDPLNDDRRFIPLRLDSAPIKGSLAQFLYINWAASNREAEYSKLLEACSMASTQTAASREPVGPPVVATRLSSGKARVNAFAFSGDGERALSGSTNGTVKLWDLGTRECLHEFKRGAASIEEVACDRDGRRAIACAGDRPWFLDLETGETRNTSTTNGTFTNREMDALRLLARGLPATEISERLGVHRITIGFHLQAARVKSGLPTRDDLRAFTKELYSAPPGHLELSEAHHAWVTPLAWSIERDHILSGSSDSKVQFCSRCAEERGDLTADYNPNVWRLAWSIDKRRVLVAGRRTPTLQLWDPKTGRCLRIFEGHTSAVACVAWSPSQRHAVSGSDDGTLRVWDVAKGRCLLVLRGHERNVVGAEWSADGSRVLSGDAAGVVRCWDLSSLSAPQSGAYPRKLDALGASDQVQYSNAKVLLVGDSGVGKSGLANYLAHGTKVSADRPLASTDGAWATQWSLHHASEKVGVARDVWLWDFAGQVDYRLVHQLFMDDAAVAVLVFNPQSDNPFDGLGNWDSDLLKAARKPFSKLLVAGRTDRGGLVVSRASVLKFMTERGFVPPFHETSAMTGSGCDQLREAIVHAIDWEGIPQTTSPVLYQQMKAEILGLRDQGIVLIRLAELKQRMEMTLGGESFELQELEAVVSLLAGPGMIRRLDFGGFIVLRPEVISRYAAALVRKVRSHPEEMGCVREDDLLAGNLDYQDFERLPPDDETVVLHALLEIFTSQGWCLRQPCDDTALLTFPSYFRRERKEQLGHPSVLVTYRFDGPVDEVYATLVVRLHHTLAFRGAQLWKSAADFNTQAGAALGFVLTRESEGESRLDAYFEPNVDEVSRVLFLRYIHDHLTQYSQNVHRLRHYECGNRKCDVFGQRFSDQSKIDRALAPGGKGKIFCPDCGTPIMLRDTIETRLDSAAVAGRARMMANESALAIDNESRELLAVHHTGFIVSEAGQIYRTYSGSDHGIDGEIEFKDDEGRASGRRLYVQLKSGDSYLKNRQRDGVEVFHAKNFRWLAYWQQQAYTVMLVVRTSDGRIRWMDVSAYLKRESAAGRNSQQIVFRGEILDVASVHRWRALVLGGSA